MKGLILLLIALTLFIPLTILNVIIVFKKYPNWQAMDGYFYETAYDIDRFGNHNFRTLLNTTLILKSGYRFGNFNETISSVLGKNERDKTLSKTGIVLVSILDFIDTNHCKKSINNF